jgi:hypothetical protein
MDPKQNENMSVTVQSMEEEEEEHNRHTVVIMFILFSASFTLMCYFYTYIHWLQWYSHADISERRI